MIKPKTLSLGDTIGVVAPSGPSCLANVEKGIVVLEDMGFKVKIGMSCYSKYGYLAGKDELRAGDINSMFADDDIDGIICLRGGYGTPRILEKIDYDNIRKNPKVYVGYSDITAIHIAINQISGLVTFHGPMITSDIIHNFQGFSKESLLNTITNNGVIGDVKNPNEENIQCFYRGKAEGRIIGGNLALICSTLGTPYEIDTRNKLLFLEDIGEEPYRVDRMLTQLRLAGKLQEVSGIILGDWNNCVPENPEKSLTLMEVFEDIILPLKKPTIANVKAGHCSPMITLPFGINAFMDADTGKLAIKEGGVE